MPGVRANIATTRRKAALSVTLGLGRTPALWEEPNRASITVYAGSLGANTYYIYIYRREPRPAAPVARVVHALQIFFVFFGMTEGKVNTHASTTHLVKERESLELDLQFEGRGIETGERELAAHERVRHHSHRPHVTHQAVALVLHDHLRLSATY